MLVSTVETTALDLVRHSFELGGLSAVAVAIDELTENLKPRKLVTPLSSEEIAEELRAMKQAGKAQLVQDND